MKSTTQNPLSSGANQFDPKPDQHSAGAVGAIWNPNAAANWSFLFTPVFGAYLHMQNWKTLGQADKAASARVWFVISLVVCVALVALQVVAGDEKGAGGAANGVGILFLLVWYFIAARPQAKYVKEKFGSTYARKPWTKPVSMGLMVMTGYIGATVLAGAVIGKLDNTPNCAANESLTTLKQAAAQRLIGALPDNLQRSVDLATYMTVDSIKTKAHDEKLDRYVCEGKLTYRLPADKAAKVTAVAEAIKKNAFGGPAKVVLDQYGPAQYGQIVAVSNIPVSNLGAQPVEANITYEIQKLEGKGEKGKFEVKVSGITEEDALAIGSMELMAALKYDAVPPSIAQKSDPEATAPATDAAKPAMDQPTAEDKNASASSVPEQEKSRPAASAVEAPVASNPVIDSWLKTCMPFTKPTDMEQQIRDGKVAWNGVKVSTVNSADAGASSVIAVTLDQSYADFKAQHPEFGKTLKLAKNQSCPAGIERSLTDKAFTGVKGATVECKCMTGGD